jgi:DNA-binding MarR family transcriptional regulator
MNETTEQFRARREGNLLRLLLRITRQMSDETVARMRARGITGMLPAYPRLLGNLDTEGTRIGALARKMGTTRQAVAQLSKEIEAAGFVQRVADPEDGRGVIVKFTKKGRAALSNAVEVIAEIEAEYVSVVGKQRLQEAKGTIADVLASLDRGGEFGLD